jgi:hypothetical protein
MLDLPRDLIDWVNSDTLIIGYLYDIDLLPEQINTKEQLCALRGFQYGWLANEDKQAKEG